MTTGITFFGSDDSVKCPASGITASSALEMSVEGLNRVLKLDKIAISESDEHRRLDRSQFFLRKSPPLKPSKLVKNLGPVLWIGSHSLVVLSLILDVA